MIQIDIMSTLYQLISKGQYIQFYFTYKKGSYNRMDDQKNIFIIIKIINMWYEILIQILIINFFYYYLIKKVIKNPILKV